MRHASVIFWVIWLATSFLFTDFSPAEHATVPMIKPVKPGAYPRRRSHPVQSRVPPTHLRPLHAVQRIESNLRQRRSRIGIGIKSSGSTAITDANGLGPRDRTGDYCSHAPRHRRRPCAWAAAAARCWSIITGHPADVNVVACRFAAAARVDGGSSCAHRTAS
jgi:hypothetical protein